MVIPIKKDSLICEGVESYRGEGDFDWNGSCLLYAVNGVAAEGKYLHGVAYDCDVSVGIYDETGEIYRGEYRSSLHAEKEQESMYLTEDSAKPDILLLKFSGETDTIIEEGRVRKESLSVPLFVYGRSVS